MIGHAMNRTLGLLGVVTVLMVALAVPAFAQAPDPYGEVLPGGEDRPGDVVAPPDGDAVAPGAADRAPAAAVSPAPGLVSAGQVRAVPPPVTVANRQLPVTGGELTITLLVLGAVLLAGGGGAVTLARRRAPDPQH